MRLVVFVLLFALFSAPAEAAKLALVVGNGAYEHTEALTNPPNDAAAFADFVRAQGFAVTLVNDATTEAMSKAIDTFVASIHPEDAAVFYYAGHGLQLSGNNYLVGVEAKLASVDDLPAQTVRLGDVVEALEQRAQITMVFVDACRTNPLAANLPGASSGQAGLAPKKCAATAP